MKTCKYSCKSSPNIALKAKNGKHLKRRLSNNYIVLYMKCKVPVRYLLPQIIFLCA